MTKVTNCLLLPLKAQRLFTLFVHNSLKLFEHREVNERASSDEQRACVNSLTPSHNSSELEPLTYSFSEAPLYPLCE